MRMEVMYMNQIIRCRAGKCIEILLPEDHEELIFLTDADGNLIY